LLPTVSVAVLLLDFASIVEVPDEIVARTELALALFGRDSEPSRIV
jgi:hypothetical protein